MALSPCIVRNVPGEGKSPADCASLHWVPEWNQLKFLQSLGAQRCSAGCGAAAAQAFCRPAQSTQMPDVFHGTNAYSAGTPPLRNPLSLVGDTNNGELDACQDHIRGGADASAYGR